MLRKHRYKVLLVLVLASAVWFTQPIYLFYAYRGKAPMPPFGLQDIPEDNQSHQVLYMPGYQKAGEEAIAILQRHKTQINVPAISAAVAIDGEIAWAGAAGWADISSRAPATPQTQFRIGSTSKALTATGLARLVDSGNIDLDTPISEYIKPLPNPNWSDITPRQLACHMSGLPHYRENTDLLGLYRSISLKTRFRDVNDALSMFDGSELLFEPGRGFSYSTYGTVLQSAAMQAASQKPFLDIIREQVLQPLAMESTMTETEAKATGRLATFYWNDEGRQRRAKPWRKVDLSHRLAGGGFISTSSDLVKLGSAYLDDQYISPKTRSIFWTPQTLLDGSVNSQNYALGWRVQLRNPQDPETIRKANHGGVSRGAQSWLMILPERQIVIAVNINSNTEDFWEFGSVSKQLGDLFIKAKQVETSI